MGVCLRTMRLLEPSLFTVRTLVLPGHCYPSGDPKFSGSGSYLEAVVLKPCQLDQSGSDLRLFSNSFFREALLRRPVYYREVLKTLIVWRYFVCNRSIDPSWLENIHAFL